MDGYSIQQSQQYPHLAGMYQHLGVKLQRGDSCPPRGRPAYKPQVGGTPAEVIGPLISTGIEKGDLAFGTGVYTTYPIALEQVATRAGITQVVGRRLPTS